MVETKERRHVKKNRKKTWIIGAVFLLVAGAGSFVLFQMKQKEESIAVKNVAETYTVKRMDISSPFAVEVLVENDYIGAGRNNSGSKTS